MDPASDACHIGLPLPFHQRPAPRVRDPDPRDLDRLAAAKDALGRRRGKLGAHDAYEDIKLEAVRPQEGVGRAVLAGGEQLKTVAVVIGRSAISFPFSRYRECWAEQRLRLGRQATVGRWRSA
jgi:hypothetical protein